MVKDTAKHTMAGGSAALSRGHKRPRSSAAEGMMTRGRKVLLQSMALLPRSKLPEGEQVSNPRGRVKRKAAEGKETPEAKIRRLFSPDKGHSSSGIFPPSVESCISFVEEVTVGKRKAVADVEGPKREKKRRLDLEDTEQKDSRAEFEAKYQEMYQQLGAGGCGAVFAGYRREDGLPVAIKHIAEGYVFCKHVDDNGRALSIEVAVMLRLQEETSSPLGAPVFLLDWYNLDKELILVHERPVPCKDLLNDIKDKGGSLPEEEAKIILKQLVDAAVDLQEKHIFHQDIKVENILIETGSDIPRVRLIDFGLSRFVKKGASYRRYYGTIQHVPPERYSCKRYRPGPTTVWQMGVVLFETLHTGEDFMTKRFMEKSLTISETLSENCQDFLRLCLKEDPKQRPSLKQLRRHRWLK